MSQKTDATNNSENVFGTSLIESAAVGLDYQLLVVHISAKMVGEARSDPFTGGSIRAEYSYKSGAICIKVMTGQRSFWEWLRDHESLLTTQIELNGAWRLKRKVVKAALERLAAAYVQWNTEGCPRPERMKISSRDKKTKHAAD